MRSHETDLADGLGLLRREGTLEPLATTDAGGCELWAAYDLASMVEGALDECVDVSVLAGAARALWLARLEGSYAAPDVHKEDLLGLRFWLLDASGERVGTVQIPPRVLGTRFVPLYSLYVLPAARRSGIATRLLERVFELACAAGLAGTRIDTHWTWQPSVRFYLARGLWVFGWKHAVTLVRDRLLPRWRVEMDADEARFAVADDTGWSDLWCARRRGERLVLADVRLVAGEPDSPRSALQIHGRATFALVLAVSGWPLIRSRRAWTRRFESSDVGEPEGLAYKIGVFEDVARESGWVVRTPRLLGLPDDG